MTDHLQSWVREQLSLEPPPRPSQILTLAREQRGYAGSDAAFFAMVSRVRGGGRVMPRPGETTEHFLLGSQVSLPGGGLRALCVLATRLRYSGYSLYSVLPAVDARSLVVGLEGHFHELSGVPGRMLFPSRWARIEGLRGPSSLGLHPLLPLLSTAIGVPIEIVPGEGGSGHRREAERLVGEALGRGRVRDELEVFDRVARARVASPTSRAAIRVYRDLRALRLLPSALVRGEVA